MIEDFRLEHIDKIIKINGVEFMTVKQCYDLINYYEDQFKRISEKYSRLTGFKIIKA